MKCPYCQGPAELVTGEVVYSHRPDLGGRHFHLCRPCWAYVGCHYGTTQPLGTLAKEDLRTARAVAHAALDPLWRSGLWTRSQFYKKLGKLMGISRPHIGNFNLKQCADAAALSTHEEWRQPCEQ